MNISESLLNLINRLIVFPSVYLLNMVQRRGENSCSFYNFLKEKTKTAWEAVTLYDYSFET